MNLKKIILISFSLFGVTFGAAAGEGKAWSWPAYSPNINYNFKDQGITYTMPTKNVSGSCINSAAGVVNKDWWCFVYGANRNSLVSDASINNLLDRFNTDFSYITDTMGWPRDKRVQDGCRSAVYLYGSMECTGSNDPEEKGGWQSWIDGYPAVAASYYPVYSFDPTCSYNDRESQMSAMIHEGIHAILTTLGASHVHWFQEGGNTWLQQEMEVRRSNGSEYSGMGFLNVVPLIAPFIPIECYSGWLADGSFGGPGAEGVGKGQDASGNTLCNWRTTLGGAQYGNLFPTFLGLWVSEGAVPWIWVNTTDASKYILETMSGTLGDAQTRRLIMEYRAKLAMLDMKKWSKEMKTLLNQQFGGTIGCEFSPCYIDNVETWKASPYVVTTNDNGILTPENRTTPGWSGANVIPLNVTGDTVKVELQPIGDNMSLQICYRATDGVPVYSEPVMGNSTAVLAIDKTPQSGVVFAVVCNTDYAYEGETTRTKHHDYRLKLVSGISSAANPNKSWYNDFVVDYDWGTDASETPVAEPIEKVAELVYEVNLPISSDYKPVSVSLEADKIAAALNISTSEMATLLSTSLFFYGVNVDSSLYKPYTANGVGHWFNTSGNVVQYEDASSSIYSELDVTEMKVNIGHYPGRIQEGDSYTIRQAFLCGNKQVTVVFNVTIKGSTSSLDDLTQGNNEMLNLYYDKGFLFADFQVPFDTKVTLSLYTAYGALIKHVVKSYLPAGSYTEPINFADMGLSKGIYLVKYTYPGRSETKVSITAPR
ncbi:MAG: DUF4859 domain-containing protein [Paludibacteraceae bacterium]